MRSTSEKSSSVEDGTWAKDYIRFEFEDDDLFVELQRLNSPLNDNWITVDLRLFVDG